MVLSWLVPLACRAGTRDFCSALAPLVGPEQNIFSLAVHYFSSFVPIAQQAGPAAMLGRLSLSVCLHLHNHPIVKLIRVKTFNDDVTVYSFSRLFP